MSEPKFVDELPSPRPGNRTPGQWKENLDALREQPDRWADMGVHTISLSTYLRKRYQEFEFAVRRDGPQEDRGKARFYARFIGGVES